jgi:hypothetical protein
MTAVIFWVDTTLGQVKGASSSIVQLTFQLYPSEVPSKASNQFLDKLQP